MDFENSSWFLPVQLCLGVKWFFLHGGTVDSSLFWGGYMNAPNSLLCLYVGCGILRTLIWLPLVSSLSNIYFASFGIFARSANVEFDNMRWLWECIFDSCGKREECKIPFPMHLWVNFVVLRRLKMCTTPKSSQRLCFVRSACFGLSSD